MSSIEIPKEKITWDKFGEIIADVVVQIAGEKKKVTIEEIEEYYKPIFKTIWKCIEIKDVKIIPNWIERILKLFIRPFVYKFTLWMIKKTADRLKILTEQTTNNNEKEEQNKEDDYKIKVIF